MFKVLEQIDGNWVERDSPAVFCREATSDGGKRLRVSLPREEPFLLFKLVEGLRPPFQLLYVLRTPRGEGEAGRLSEPPTIADADSGFYETLRSVLFGGRAIRFVGPIRVFRRRNSLGPAQ